MNDYGYPQDWVDIAYAVKEAAGWRCSVCGVQCRRPGELWLGWRYTLTVAHWWHEYDTPTTFVVAACLPCHFRHDAPYVWPARRRVERWRQREAGQMALFAGQ